MKKWILSRNNLRENIMNRAPFYPQEHYDMFISILEKGTEIKNYLDDKKFSFQVNEDKLNKMYADIKEEREKTLAIVRNYLKEYRLENIDDPRYMNERS